MRVFVQDEYNDIKIQVYEINYIGWKNNIFEMLEEDFTEAENDNEENIEYLKELFANKGYLEIIDLNGDTRSYVSYVDKKDAENILHFIAINGYVDLRKYSFFDDSLGGLLEDIKTRWLKGYPYY